MKILFLGFSVTEAANSYAYQMMRELQEAGHEAELLAMGGTHPQYIPYFIDRILAGKNYDHVILEVFTSAYREWWRKLDDYCWPLWHMSEACIRHGATPTLLALHRRDVDFTNDLFLTSGYRVSERMGIPLMNATSIFEDADMASIFKDEVHPTDEGSARYVDFLRPRLFELVERARMGSPDIQVFEAGGFFSIPIADLPETDDPRFLKGSFSRSGWSVPYVVCAANDSLTINLPRQTTVNAVSFIMGPRSSSLSFGFDGGPPTCIPAYDEYCYYERFQAHPIGPTNATSVTIGVDPAVPEIELKKGEKDGSQRIGQLCHLFCSRETLDKLIRTASRAWS